jgi:hypothetical protein
MTAHPGSTIYYTLDGSDPRAFGGEIASNARTYTGPITLSASARVVARAWDSNHRNLTGSNRPPLSSPWSGPQTAVFAVATRPSFASIGIQGGACILRFQSAAGQTYSVLYSDALPTGTWTKLTDVAPPTAGMVSITDPAFGKAPARFYMLVTPASTPGAP